MRRWGVNLLNLIVGALLMAGVLEGVAAAYYCYDEYDSSNRKTCTVCCEGQVCQRRCW